MLQPCLLKYTMKFCGEKFVRRCIDSVLVKYLATLGADSVNFTAGIGNAFIVFNGDS